MQHASPAIAAIAAPFPRDVEACLDSIERWVGQAAEQGAQLVAFPECSIGGYLREPDAGGAGPVLPVALAPDGPEIERLCAIAGGAGVMIVAGYSEASDGAPYTSAVCVDASGVLGHQRKVHLPPGERFAYQAGEGFCAFDTPLGRIGMLVCYDKSFPEAARTLALDGAEIIVSIAAWPVCRRNPARRIAQDRQTLHFNALDVARALENQVVWVSTNTTGRDGPLRFIGQAKVVSPRGEIIAATGARAGIALARIDAREQVRDARMRIDYLADRRPAAYAAATSSAVGIPAGG